MGDKRILFAIILLMIGLFLCFFGLKMKIITLFVIGFITGFAGIILIIGEITSTSDIPEFSIWILIFLSCGIGIMAGYITVQLKKVGYFLTGVWLGIVVAFILNNALFHRIDTGGSSLVLMISVGVFGLMLGILSFYLHEHLVIISSSVIGGYSIIRPFGFFFNDYPN